MSMYQVPVLYRETRRPHSKSRKSANTIILLARVSREDMGCTLGTTPEYSLLPRTHKMQKPNVSQGLYQSYYSPYWLWWLAPTPAFVFCRDWTPNVSYLKRQSTTRPHQLVRNCNSILQVGQFEIDWGISFDNDIIGWRQRRRQRWRNGQGGGQWR